MLARERHHHLTDATTFEMKHRNAAEVGKIDATNADRVKILLQRHGDPETFDPDQFEADFKAELWNQEQAIGRAPGGEPMRTRLRASALELFKGAVNSVAEDRSLPARGHPWLSIGLAMILGGAMGNAYDRFVQGHVVDFLHFHLGGSYFPAFNVADIGITTGAIMLVIDALMHTRRTKARSA